MPIFEYQAVDNQGRVHRGTVLGVDFDAASRQLKEQGLQVRGLSEAKGGFDDPVATAQEPMRPVGAVAGPPVEPRSYVETNVVGALVGGVALTNLHFFFRQLGTMLHAGINPAQALETLATQTPSPKLRKVVLETRDHVMAGRPMTSGFQRYPEVFSPLMVSMLRVGEEGGFMAEQCRQLSEYIQRDIELRNLIRRETFYPKAVIGASVIIIMGVNAILASIAPGKSGIAAPVAIWATAAALLVGWFLFKKFGLPHGPVRYTWDNIVNSLPWFGKMVHGFAMAKFGRAFGALYKGGVPTQKALRLAADACGNEAVRLKIYQAAGKLEGGAGITETFVSTGAFSPIVIDMVRTGEMTGNLDEMLIKTSEYYEDEGQTKARQSATLLGVLALVMVGAYVGYIAVSFYTGFGQGVQQQINDANAP
ncbi:MAG: type II secretion system F family protein [Fimbriimonadaceae bacterium]|nr:type II secretion system F family protein [Fimbriimonadaceae bacterium]